MSSIISVDMPTSQYQFSKVYKAEYNREMFRHDYATITMRDWDLSSKFARPGVPIKTTISGKEFYGYIHDISGHMDNGTSYTEVGVIGASYVMRQASQKLYKNVTADAVIIDIATRYNFAYRVTPHPRVYPQIAQAGATDWELMVKLAKQCGYALWADGASITFQPMFKDLEDRGHEAAVFTKATQGMRVDNPIYYFKPLVGETLSHAGADRAATSVAGVDPATGNYFKYTKPSRDHATRQISQHELFDKQGTHTVANNYSTAVSESVSADERSSFPYIAEVEVIGNSGLRPGMPVYLENIGNEYSGYWVVITVDHEVKEQQRHNYLHTSVLRVGTDSLGQTITPGVPQKPTATPIRKLTPNVRNVRLEATTVLRTSGAQFRQPTLTSVVNRVNRADVVDHNLQKANWVSTNRDLVNRAVEVQKSPIVKNKVLKYAARL